MGTGSSLVAGMKVVVLGAACIIGARHVVNVRALGHDVMAIDPAIDRNIYNEWPEHVEGGAVVIASPTVHHAQQATTAILSGAEAVLVEKPPARTWGDWAPVVLVAERQLVKLAVAFNWRFHPAAKALRNLGGARQVQFTALDDIGNWPNKGAAHLRQD